GDDVVNRLEADGVERPRTVAVRVERLVAGREHAAVTVAIHKAVRRVAVRLDGRILVDAVRVLQQGRRLDPDGAALRGRRVSQFNVLHFQRDVLYPVAVLAKPFAIGVLRSQG